MSLTPALDDPSEKFNVPSHIEKCDPAVEKEAEELARKLYYHFELDCVQTTFKGSWKTFLDCKTKLEKKFDVAVALDTKKGKYQGKGPHISRSDRRFRVLEMEYKKVARMMTKEIRETAAAILVALKEENLDFFADNCANETGKREWLRKNMEMHRTFAEAFNPKEGFSNESLAAPDLDFGKPASIRLSFGEKIQRPANIGSNMYPEYREIELWWSGQVMPAPNAVAFAHPTAPHITSVGKWKFSNIILPYSKNSSGMQ